jgi:hypothetical protein
LGASEAAVSATNTLARASGGSGGGGRSGISEEVEEEGVKEPTLRADGFIYVSESLDPWFNLTLEDWWVVLT